MAGLGVPELLIILVILLLVLGPKRLPGLGRQLGGGMREFKESISRKHAEDDDAATPPAAPPQASLPESTGLPAEPLPVPGSVERDPAVPPRT